MKTLRIDKIRLDGGTQMRVGPRNGDALEDYKAVLREGGALPAVVVFFDGRDYWLADGFHRWSAHKELALDDIQADVREGGKRDAILYAVGANASHGLRRTNQDKRRAVETLLKDEEWGQWSSREIARRAHVHHQLVERLRQELKPHLDEHPDGSICGNSADNPATRTVQRGGTTFTQNTANIGQRPPVPPASEPRPVAPSLPDQIPAAGKLMNTSVSSASIPPTPEAEVIPPAPPLVEQVAEPGEQVIQAQDVYIPFHDDEAEQRRKTAEEIERGVKDIHNALERLLKRERDGRGLLAMPDPYTRSVRSLAWHAREMLDEWLDEPTEKDSRTITIDAMN